MEGAVERQRKVAEGIERDQEIARCNANTLILKATAAAEDARRWQEAIDVIARIRRDRRAVLKKAGLRMSLRNVKRRLHRRKDEVMLEGMLMEQQYMECQRMALEDDMQHRLCQEQLLRETQVNNIGKQQQHRSTIT